MTEIPFVLDTNAVIFLTTAGNVIPPGLQDELNQTDLFISVITEIELLSKPALPPGEEENLRSLIAERMPIIDLTDTVKREAIALRRSGRLKLPDCIVAATAIATNAVLLTDDTKLLRLAWPGYAAKNLNPISGRVEGGHG